MTETILHVLPNFKDLRWELCISNPIGPTITLGYHKRSDVCDYWAEIISNSTVPRMSVLHWSDSRAENVKLMEQMRKEKKR